MIIFENNFIINLIVSFTKKQYCSKFIVLIVLETYLFLQEKTADIILLNKTTKNLHKQFEIFERIPYSPFSPE